MKKKLHLRTFCILALAFCFTINFNSCRSEATNSEYFIQTPAYKSNVQRKKLSEVSELIPTLNEIKAKIKSSNNILNKGVEDFEIDEDNILVAELQEQTKTISMVVKDPVNQTNYSVTNLVIVKHGAIENYFLIKYIPTNGLPFYSYADFVGTIQYMDLDGNILATNTPTNKEEIIFQLGCWTYIAVGCNSCNGGEWAITGYNHCDSGTSGGHGSTGGYEEGGSGESGGGGGGTPTNTPPTIPNIPSQNTVDILRYKNFLQTQLTPQELQILLTNQNLSDHIFYYQQSNYHSLESRNNSKWFMNFYTQTPDAEPFSIFDFGTKFIDENTDIVNPQNVFLRAYALEKFLVQNPDGLLDIPCNQLPLWQDVATHQVPQSVKTKMQNIKNQTNYYDNWELTDLDNGLGTKLNMDLFPVKITNMPNKPNGEKYTPAEFFDFFRKNINLFAEKFTPIVDTYYGINDTALWNSTNPLGALIHIEIPADDGTVVCSGYWTNSWIFSTVKAPFSHGYDGVHPVAGNRLFSYYMEGSTMYIYTRGVDRVSNNYSDTATVLNYVMQAAAFLGADQLWKGMQTKLSTYITDNDGNASIVQPITYRPNYNEIKNYMKGSAPLSSLGCN